MPEEERMPILQEDELELWRDAFIAQIRARKPIEVAFEYASEALDAYRVVREDSYLMQPCECPHCVAARDGKTERVN